MTGWTWSIRAAVTLLVIALLTPACGGQGRRGAGEPVTGKSAAQPPPQPTSGPGGSAYAHARVAKGLSGQGAQAYWLFEPADPPATGAPVVLFLHGWRGTDPDGYGGWIEHLVRRGNIVIYPVFEKSRNDSAEEMLAAALQGARAGVDRVRQSGRGDLNRFAIVGHSLGGGMTPHVAARARAAGLPEPRAIMPVQPGWRGGDKYPTDGLAQVPASVLMLVVIGGQDQFASSRHDRAIWEATKQVPPDRKRYVVVQGDDHGSPALVADHSSPLAYREDYGDAKDARSQRRIEFLRSLTGMRENRANALNYYGYWRLFDALTEAAWAGRPIDAAIQAAQSSARWSDGTPLKPLVVRTAP
jgi:dienelactone hydrolase